MLRPPGARAQRRLVDGAEALQQRGPERAASPQPGGEVVVVVGGARGELKGP